MIKFFFFNKYGLYLAKCDEKTGKNWLLIPALPVPGKSVLWNLFHLEAGERTKKMSTQTSKTHGRSRRYQQIKMAYFKYSVCRFIFFYLQKQDILICCYLRLLPCVFDVWVLIFFVLSPASRWNRFQSTDLPGTGSAGIKSQFFPVFSSHLARYSPYLLKKNILSKNEAYHRVQREKLHLFRRFNIA